MISLYYFLLTQSIMAACIIGGIRYPQMNRAYRPFVFICFIDLATEILVYCLIRQRIIPYPAANVFILCSSVLFIWLFRLWGMLNNRYLFWGLLTFQVAFWFMEHFYFDSITNVTPYYRIEYSLVLVFLAVSTINKQLVQFQGNLLKNAQFIICSGLIIFFTYSIFVEIIYLKSEVGSNFQAHVFTIKQYINVLTNVLFAFAMLWVPVKKRYTMLY
ncbi:MAG: hypothetical protein INR69_08965 [Mucilaginibacter polytrichastri]|nr:hypothetical protein [Mucilaginibacter polytrichastri]